MSNNPLPQNHHEESLLNPKRHLNLVEPPARMVEAIINSVLHPQAIQNSSAGGFVKVLRVGDEPETSALARINDQAGFDYWLENMRYTNKYGETRVTGRSSIPLQHKRIMGNEMIIKLTSQNSHGIMMVSDYKNGMMSRFALMRHDALFDYVHSVPEELITADAQNHPCVRVSMRVVDSLIFASHEGTYLRGVNIGNGYYKLDYPINRSTIAGRVNNYYGDTFLHTFANE